MIERPILFNDAMVRAILDGRKTQTRRVVKPQPVGDMAHDNVQIGSCCYVVGAANGSHNYGGVTLHKRMSESGYESIACPYGQPGDRMWVRESARLIETSSRKSFAGNITDDYTATKVRVRYEADKTESDWLPYPSRLAYLDVGSCIANGCYREAARFLLEVTGVRVERLQDISEADAIEESARFTDFGLYVPNGKASLDGGKTFHPFKPRQHSGWHVDDVKGPDQCLESARGAFANYINKLHGGPNWNCKGPSLWDTNPWVWVIEFKRVAA